jgi:hypothetical protein
MGSLIGFNVDQSTVKDWPRFVSHLGKTRPAWCLTFGVDSANALRNAGVKNVAVRIYNGEGSVAGKMTADGLKARFQNVANNHHWCELVNEVGLQTSWLLTVLPPLLAAGYKVTAPALSSGTPESDSWNSTRKMFEIAAQYPDTFRFSVHEYINFVPFNMQAKYWSPSMPLPSHPWYYEGRFETYVYPLCDTWGLPHPKYVITELGIAAQNGAQNAPTASNGYPGPNGWYSIAGWLESMYPGASAATTYARMITYLAQALYGRHESTCEGVAIYCLGADWTRTKGSQEDWSGFDLEAGNSAATFYQEFEAYAMSSTTPTPWMAYQLTVAAGASVNLRSAANTSAAIVQVVAAGRYSVQYDPGFEATANGFTWRRIRFGNGTDGYIAASLPTVTLEVAPPPPVVTPPDTITISRADWDALKNLVNKYQ